MAGGINLALKYQSEVDERWTTESQAQLALGAKFDVTGVKTVRIYSIPVAVMHDYVRSGVNRYGTPEDLARNVQEETMKMDRGFTFIIDAGDKAQSQNVSDAGAALARQIKEVIVPEFDTYCFKVLAETAQAAGGYATTPITKANAYEAFLNGQEYLGDHNVPAADRVCFASYRYCNLIMQDPAFMKAGDRSQDMITKGVIGEVDGVEICKVASNKLPAGCAFILANKECAGGPEQLQEFKIHDNPPGISGWLVEGRTIYDCFVLNEKRHGIYYHGGQTVFKVMNAMTAATGVGKTTLLVNGMLNAATNKWYYVTAEKAADLTAITYDQAITVGNWTEMKDANNRPINFVEITPTAGHTIARIVEVDSANKPVAFADVLLSIGE